MIRDRRSNQSQSTTLVVLLAAFALLAGLYYSLRYGGWAIEGDDSSQATAAVGTLKTGQLENASMYNNGFGYAAQLAFVSLVTGLPVQPVQLGSSLWVFVVALVAFITYREFLGSAAVAALGVLLLFLQPDFLFYIVRGAHEKYIWTYALLMLFLLARSYHYIQKPLKLLLYVGLFYLVFWAFVSGNVYFASTFMGAILLSFAGGWVLSRLGGRRRSVLENRNQALRRLIVISLACFMLVYVFVNYAYQPALQFYYIFSSMADRVSLLVLGTQPVDAPASYQAFELAWRSPQAYLALTGLQWLIALVSLAAWGVGLFQLSRMDQKRWLLWLMYSAFGVLLAYGVVADYAGFMSANLQLRMFTPFILFSSPMAAVLISRGFHALRARWRRLAAMAVVIVVTCGAATVILKVTNDPSLGNQWFFYTPAEFAPSSWIDRNGVQQQQVWIDTGRHLATVYYFWEGYRPITPYQYLWGRLQSPAPYTLISELTRLRANRSGVSLPATSDQNRVYDNGQVQLYHRRPLTPYQR